MRNQNTGRNRSKKKSIADRKAKGVSKPKVKKFETTADRKLRKSGPSSENKGKRTFDKYKDLDINDMKLPKHKEGKIRLNRYLSNAGICSRREADQLIQLGLISVNGKVVEELGMKVGPDDTVKYDGGTVNKDQYRYVLLNKPKNYIVSMDDSKGRKTVMSLVQKACKEQIYPVDKLDRMTTGLMMFTNDGDLAKKLTSPKYDIEKLYFIQLAEKVKTQHLKQLREGIQLDDGFIRALEVDYVKDSNDQRLVGIRVQSNKNKIVRRMFEYFGYTITKLDRVMYAGLTKKDLGRGYNRHLTEKEVAFLKMLK